MELEPLSFIKSYLNALKNELQNANNNSKITCVQMAWLAFCLILLSNSICWAKFTRVTLGGYGRRAISWMFRHSKLPWDNLLADSVMAILKKYDIHKGILVIDDKDISRSKNAKKIFKLHKYKDKKTNGYLLGQNLIMLYLVSDKISIPISFVWYSPDPLLTEWWQKDKKLRKAKVPKNQRPSAPQRSQNYPKKYELALKLLQNFKEKFSEVNVICVLADALYGHKGFIDGVEQILPGVQVITQLRKNQIVRSHNQEYSCEEYFKIHKKRAEKIVVRGRKIQDVYVSESTLYVRSQDTQRRVIALKYEGENECRYLVASNLSWNTRSIVQAYTVRWLIEVFFEDWSCYGGFCSLAKQCGVEGSERPLSLLFDHCFFFHEHQQISIEKRLPLATFGSLIEKTRMEAFLRMVQRAVEEQQRKDSSKQAWEEVIKHMNEIFEIQPSKKHFSDLDIEIEDIIQKTA
jgi:DDE superfamily endonuclease